MQPEPVTDPDLDPKTGSEIARELRALHERSTHYWQSFSTAEFLAPLGDRGEAWSPADNVRHLTKSIRPLAKALRLPWPILRLRYGRPAAPSRSYSEMRDVYRGALADGLQAGRFAPAFAPPPANPDAYRAQLMARREQVASALDLAIARWSEPALDRCRLPHPALGRITVREMLFHPLPQSPSRRGRGPPHRRAVFRSRLSSPGDSAWHRCEVESLLP